MTESRWEGQWKELGAFGNVWIRLHVLRKAGQANQGHRHNFDHVTIVATGGVRCEIDGRPPQDFMAPVIIEIAKNIEHRFSALADDTTYYCVFAVRDDAGQVTDVFDGAVGPYTHACSNSNADCAGCPTQTPGA
jgi:hypothetical protein